MSNHQQQTKANSSCQHHPEASNLRADRRGAHLEQSTKRAAWQRLMSLAAHDCYGHGGISLSVHKAAPSG